MAELLIIIILCILRSKAGITYRYLFFYLRILKEKNLLIKASDVCFLFFSNHSKSIIIIIIIKMPSKLRIF